MNPLLIPVVGEIVGKVGQLADDLFTSDEERAKASLDAYQAETARMNGQVEINKIEAGSNDKFASRWRPAIGWVGVVALAYQFVAYPLLTWGWSAMQAAGWISMGLMAPPLLDVEALLTLVFALLGVGTMRSFDKTKRTTK